MSTAAPSMLVLPPELTHAHASASLRMLKQTLRSHKEPQLVVDASALKRFDSSALAVLLECRRTALEFGKSFSINGLPAALGTLAQLYGVQDLLSPSARVLFPSALRFCPDGGQPLGAARLKMIGTHDCSFLSIRHQDVLHGQRPVSGAARCQSRH